MSFKRSNKIKILIFGHKEFSQLLSSVLSEFEREAECRIVDAIIGTLNEAHAHVDLFNPDVVISAGSNAAYLKASLKVPVLSLPVTESDVLCAIQKAAKLSKQVHLITFDDYSHLVKLLNETSGLELKHSHYETAEEARQTYHLSQISQDDSVVGASLVCGLAVQDNIKSFLIYSRASCKGLLERAISLAKEERQKGTALALQQWLYEDAKIPIVVYEKETQKITSNIATEKDLDLDSNFIELSHFLSEHSLNNLTDGECYFNRKRWIFHKDSLEVNQQHFDIYQFYPEENKGQSELNNSHDKTNLVFESKVMAQVIQKVDIYANAPSHCLIIGESGTGKEMIARRIHAKSRYNKGQFVAINCAAMPSELFEGELFGYVDGAYTGSRKGGKKGLLHEAQFGVLFLDEVGELSLPQQAKLLRVIQEKNYRPIGSHKEYDINFKIVAATNRPLLEQVKEGKFRDDLFYRLNVLSIQLPPLRERFEDLPVIAGQKLTKLASEFTDTLISKMSNAELLEAVLPYFLEYSWPGNVRELENVLERLLAFANALPIATQADIKTLLEQLAPEILMVNPDPQEGMLAHNELVLVQQAMSQFDGNKELVAQYLGISQTTLWRRLKRINDNNQRETKHA